MKTKGKHKGFTIIELLTVLAIIALLTGILIPSLSRVRYYARQTRQEAQLGTINMALLAFRCDYGDYPESFLNTSPDNFYCGAHKLAEALVGWDLLGFHPDSHWNAYGDNGAASPTPIYIPNDEANLRQRFGPYLERTRTDVFTLTQIYGQARVSDSDLADRYVLCDTYGIRDTYGRRRVELPGGELVTPGRPVLYYRANPNSRTITARRLDQRIYNHGDNIDMIFLNNPSPGNPDLLWHQDVFYQQYIIDPQATTVRGGVAWPYRPDSYILISAGEDGEYGTEDDITNFGN